MIMDQINKKRNYYVREFLKFIQKMEGKIQNYTLFTK